jgi:Ankyrin repeats (3 copies)
MWRRRIEKDLRCWDYDSVASANDHHTNVTTLGDSDSESESDSDSGAGVNSTDDVEASVSGIRERLLWEGQDKDDFIGPPNERVCNAFSEMTDLADSNGKSLVMAYTELGARYNDIVHDLVHCGAEVPICSEHLSSDYFNRLRVRVWSTIHGADSYGRIVGMATRGRVRIMSVHTSIVGMYEQHLDRAEQNARSSLKPSMAARLLYNPRYVGIISDFLGFKEPEPAHFSYRLGGRKMHPWLMSQNRRLAWDDPLKVAVESGNVGLVLEAIQRTDIHLDAVSVDRRRGKDDRVERRELGLFSNPSYQSKVRPGFKKGDFDLKVGKGHTLLHLAALEGDADMVGALVALGADIGARDNDGWTALHHATKLGHLGVVRVLVNTVADRRTLNKAARIASKYNQRHVFNFFMS